MNQPQRTPNEMQMQAIEQIQELSSIFKLSDHAIASEIDVSHTTVGRWRKREMWPTPRSCRDIRLLYERKKAEQV